MPIRYPIAFRGTARPSGCSAWRLKVPKIERLTHPKPYIVPKTFDCFSLICSSRNPISCRNPILCRNLLLISALFAHSETLYRAETRYFAETFCLFQPYLLKAKPYIVPKTRCSSETFCLFQPYLFKPKPYIVSKPDTLPKPDTLLKPFACFSLIYPIRNPRFSWNSERLCISVKPRLAFVISETCKPFSSLSAFSPFSATKAVLRV